ncbi:tyrosine-type recombinase/integrase [Streptomyces sp. NPDC047009]|uniref:tyrosine-type recombinase/integrase n=1 Tax=Streptomyces sp. NPDC047009 TaxID=3154496 RepID=UPI0033E5C25F
MKTPKNGRALPVRLPLICLSALRRHQMRQTEAARRKGVETSPSSCTFTTRTDRPIDPRNINRSFFRITAAAVLRRIRPHHARHGCITLLTADGVAPRETLGHSQISITMDVCTHVTSDTAEVISHMDRLVGRRPDRG